MVGQTLAHYRILEQIGAGGMGEVYRAQDTKLGREVAIKVLPDLFAQDAERLGRFQREAQLLASLNHPNIAAIYGVEESDRVRYLVLELVPGQTLAERLASGPLPISEGLQICRQIAEALEAAHEKGIIHRDLKPGNVKVTPAGKVKVLDFGLAKAFEGETAAADLSKSPTLTSPATQRGVLLGTAAYMSPEQARGKAVDKRTDIWAFGCVLYETLTGRQAFEGETVSDTIAAVLKSEPDWRVLPAHTPANIAVLLHRCLQKDPARRLHDIADARLEMEEAPGERAPAPAPAPFAASRPAAWRRVIPWAIAALMTVAASVSTWEALRQNRPSGRPAARFSVALPPAQALEAGRGPGVAVSPDGTRIVYVTGRGPSTQLYLRALDQLEPKPIPGTEGAYDPFFSPDGQWLAFFNDPGELKKVAVAGGPALTLCDAPAAWGGTWASDNTIIFASHWLGEGLVRVSAAGGPPEGLTKPDPKKGESSHRWPEVLPGGKAVLFTVGTGASFDDARIAVLSLKTGQWRTLIEGGSNARYLPTGHLVYARAGALLVVPFNLDRLEVTGPLVPALEGVLTNATYGHAQYNVSADGTLVYVPGSSVLLERTLVWVDRKGAERPLTELRQPYEDLDLSPDGRQLALTLEGVSWNVWLYDLARGSLSRLTFEESNTDPLWTPDGKRVVYTSFRNGLYGLYWRAADGSGPEEQLTTSDYFLHAFSWLPDGKLLAFSERNPTTAGDLWVLPLDERQRRPFLRTPFYEEFPALSPDGRWIAYTSNESGRQEVYVLPFPGPGGKVQISTEGGTRSIWSINGRELFYRNGDKMMVVAITTQPTFIAGKPRVLFERQYWQAGHDYDPTPDGQRFVMIKESQQQAGGTQLNVVLNWFDELKHLAPPGKK